MVNASPHFLATNAILNKNPKSAPLSLILQEFYEAQILKFCNIARSATEISNLFGIKDKSYFRKKINLYCKAVCWR